MKEEFLRKGFDELKEDQRIRLMEALARSYDMEFQGLRLFSRWGNGITTGVFQQSGREFVFVPGDSVTLGWDRFAVGPDADTEADFLGAFEEFEYTGTIEDFIRADMTPVREAAISPMLVARRMEEICWETVGWTDPRLTGRKDWLEQWKEFAAGGGNGLNIAGEVKFLREEEGWRAAIYHDIDYLQLRQELRRKGLSLPTADQWEYLCGGGCRTLFPWGDSFDYTAMHLHHFEERGDMRPYDMEEPNFFGLSIAFDPYKREIVEGQVLAYKGGDGGCNICGGLGPLFGYLPCSPYYKPEVEDGDEPDGDYDFIRPVIVMESDEILF